MRFSSLDLSQVSVEFSEPAHCASAHSSKFSAFLVPQEHSQGPTSEGTPTGPNQQLRVYLQVGSIEPPRFLIQRFSGSYQKLHINRHCVILRNWSISPNKSRSVLIVVAQFLSSTPCRALIWQTAHVNPIKFSGISLPRFYALLHTPRAHLLSSTRRQEIASTFCTNPFSGGFNRGSRPIWIISEKIKSRFSQTLPAHNIV